jgi:DHA2 family multidrug resistance protein
VAILATLLTSRVSYHAQQFGSSISQTSEIYQQTARNERNYLVHTGGSSPGDASRQSQYLIMSNLSTQAYIQGINDDFLLAGIITLTGVIPILFLRTKKSKHEIIPIQE